MKKLFNIISVIVFGLDVMVYTLFFNGIDLFPDEAILPLIISGSIIGVILASFGKKSSIRKIGFFGNIFVLTFTVVVPVIVRTFIWNTP